MCIAQRMILHRFEDQVGLHAAISATTLIPAEIGLVQTFAVIVYDHYRTCYIC